MRYFYDCEFIEDGTTIDLVSVGVVAEDGREFYAVSTEFDSSTAGPWVRRNVLPKLPNPSSAAWMSSCFSGTSPMLTNECGAPAGTMTMSPGPACSAGSPAPYSAPPTPPYSC